MLKGRDRSRSNLHLRGLWSGDGQEGLSGERDHSKETITVLWGEVKDCDKRKGTQEGEISIKTKLNVIKYGINHDPWFAATEIGSG